jgi:hypothetical protein
LLGFEEKRMEWGSEKPNGGIKRMEVAKKG